MNSDDDIFGGKYVRNRAIQWQHHDSSDSLSRPNIRRLSFNLCHER